MMIWKDEIQAIISSLIGGARYGVKVRFPHALIMTYLYRNDLNSTDKIRLIIQLVKEHATNLALFATIYKSVLLILKWHSYHNKNQQYLTYSNDMSRNQTSITSDSTTTTTSIAMAGLPQSSHHALIAGLIGGYTIWGRYSSINYQIVLYLTSRVMVALSQRLIMIIQQQQQQQQRLQSQSKHISNSLSLLKIFWQRWLKDRIYSMSTATIWGIVMYLFEDSPEFLHPSLKSSMDEIYRSTSSKQ